MRCLTRSQATAVRVDGDLHSDPQQQGWQETKHKHLHDSADWQCGQLHLWNSVTLFQGKETVNAIGVVTVNAIGVGTVVCHGAGGAGGVVGVAKDSSCESGVSTAALYAAGTTACWRSRCGYSGNRVLVLKVVSL